MSRAMTSPLSRAILLAALVGVGGCKSDPTEVVAWVFGALVLQFYSQRIGQWLERRREQRALEDVDAFLNHHALYDAVDRTVLLAARHFDIASPITLHIDDDGKYDGPPSPYVSVECRVRGSVDDVLACEDTFLRDWIEQIPMEQQERVHFRHYFAEPGDVYRVTRIEPDQEAQR